MPIVCANLILEFGFGPGNFSQNLNAIEPGAPCIILGSEFQEYGIPGLPTASFPFENPGQIVTFHWFKHNIKCLEHPWICGGKKETRPNMAKKTKEREGARKAGERKISLIHMQ